MKIDREHELQTLREVQTSSKTVFDGVLLHVKQDTVSLPNSGSGIREVIRHIGAVCVIPVTQDNQVIVERQYRYPIARVTTEIPAGKLDSREEDRLDAIKRELGGRWAAGLVLWQCAIAWFAALLVHLLGMMLGLG